MRTKRFNLCFLVLNQILLLLANETPQELPKIISNQMRILMQTKKISDTLTDAVDKMSDIKDRKIANEVFCKTCELISKDVIDYRRQGGSQQSISDYLKQVCQIFNTWEPTVCEGYVNIKLNTLLYIIDKKKGLTGQRFCSIVFQTKNCIDPKAKKWIVEIPPKKDVIIKPKSDNETTTLKILHLTDFHYDPLYAPGSNAVCDLPLCCQESSGFPAKSENRAGYWGDYNVCDMPWHTITNFTDYLLDKNETYDFVYYTGDIISHRDWDINQTSNTETIKKLFYHFNTTFRYIPLFSVLGNHESHPSHFFSTNDIRIPRISTQWIFDLMATEWKQWLPPDTENTIRKGGYYNILARPGFRVIALNSNFCYTSNLWLVYEDEDPADQLKWLVEVLTKAEMKGEKVHILLHVPPGDSECHRQWTIQYRRIVNRFASTITAQFNGHSHYDELRLFRDTNNSKKIINVAFNAGSFTTFVGLNPNYRIYDVSGKTFEVIDYNHYTFNLTEANLHIDRAPAWYKLYSFRDAYGLKTTSYEDLADLIERMSWNLSLVEKYHRYLGRESAPHLAENCNEVCLLRTLCSITAVEAGASIACQLGQQNQDLEPSGAIASYANIVVTIGLYFCASYL